MEHTINVRANADEGRFELFRMIDNGSEVLYTHVPWQTGKGKRLSFKKIATQLGECILLDLEEGRNLI